MTHLKAWASSPFLSPSSSLRCHVLEESQEWAWAKKAPLRIDKSLFCFLVSATREGVSHWMTLAMFSECVFLRANGKATGITLVHGPRTEVLSLLVPWLKSQGELLPALQKAPGPELERPGPALARGSQFSPTVSRSSVISPVSCVGFGRLR